MTKTLSAPLDRPSVVRSRRSLIIQIAVFAITIAIVAAPLVPIVYQSVLDQPIYATAASLTLDNFVNLLGDQRMWAALKNTVIFAVISTIVATVCGVLAAIVVVRSDMPLRGLFGDLFMIPLYVSSLVIAFGWTLAYGPAGMISLWVKSWLGFIPWELYSLGGIAVVGGICGAPITYLYCSASARMQDSSLEESARVIGATPFRILRTINVPMLLPAVLHSVSLNIIASIDSLALPLILGRPVNVELFTTYIYTRGMEYGSKDYGLMASAAILLLALVTALTIIQVKMVGKLGRFVSVGGKAKAMRTLRLGAWRWPVFFLFAAYLGIFVMSAVVMIGLRAFTTVLSPFVPLSAALSLDNFRQAFSNEVIVRAIWNTLQISIIGGAIGTAFIALLSVVIYRSNFRFSRSLDFIAYYPRAIPGLVVGIGAFYAVAFVPGLSDLRNSIWILMIVFIARYLPNGLSAVAPVLAQIDRSLDMSAKTIGADWWHIMRTIMFPLISPALLSCFLILFISFIKEYASAVFLFAPGAEVVGAVMLIFWRNADAGAFAVLAFLQIITVAVIVFLLRHLSKGARLG